MSKRIQRVKKQLWLHDISEKIAYHESGLELAHKHNDTDMIDFHDRNLKIYVALYATVDKFYDALEGLQERGD